MSSVEQSRDISEVKEEMKKMLDQGLISYGDIYKIIASFVKPGTKESLGIVSDLINEGLINDSDGLHLLEGPK